MSDAYYLGERHIVAGGVRVALDESLAQRLHVVIAAAYDMRGTDERMVRLTGKFRYDDNDAPCSHPFVIEFEAEFEPMPGMS